MTKLALRLSSGALALLLVAGCDGGGGNSAASGGSEDTTARFAAAADTLSQKVQGGQVPPADDPAVKAFEAESSRALQALGTPAMPLDGFESFDKLCAKTAGIVGAYVNAGVDRAPETEKAALMERNVEQHLDTLFTPLLFSARCMAAHMSFFEKEVGDDTGAKAAALAQVRGGAHQQMSGLLEMVGATDLDLPRRRRALDLVADNADEFAIVLSTAQRQQLASAAESLRASLPEDARGQVDKIKTGLTTAPCNALCKM